MDIKRYLRKESSVLHTGAYTQRETHTHDHPATSHPEDFWQGGQQTEPTHCSRCSHTHVLSTHTCKVSGTSHCYPEKVGIPGHMQAHC